ncbi:DUF6415 family natural product biosynthesis protein [Streptomyces sp. NPDC001982]|uniref:DUF6415 family natural product biosynthesis protein n=1 Tax=Streptomyces sp. NPDC001982 TaxID=3154405 RepID=UPI00331C5E8C
MVRLQKGSIPRYCALTCLGEARGKLKAEPNPAPGGDLAYARRLARALNALCDHFDALRLGSRLVPHQTRSPCCRLAVSARAEWRGSLGVELVVGPDVAFGK